MCDARDAGIKIAALGPPTVNGNVQSSFAEFEQ
jgi:hypothetical protein